MHQSALIAAAIAALGVACSDSNDPVNETDPNPDENLLCAVDPSLDFDSAYPIVVGTQATETFCPRRDQDFYSIDSAGGLSLVDLDVQYQKVSPLQLAVDWYGPKGLCAPANPTGCTQTSECAIGEICDVDRGGCRGAQADDCFRDDQCSSGEVCAFVQRSLLTQTVEPSLGGSLHRVNTNLPAFASGTYYAIVYDFEDQEEDKDTQYTLDAVVSDDLDSNEPNNAMNQATALTSSQGATGYLSYVGDSDWYRISPPNPSAASIITIESRASANQTALPQWRLMQGSLALDGPNAVFESSGSGQEVVRRLTWLLTGTEDIYFEVTNTALDGSVDSVNGYTFTVTITEDPGEATRDDTPSVAQTFDATVPPQMQSFTGTIAAPNDRDWYRISRTETNNSLLYTRIVSTSENFLLRANFYVPNTTSCSDNADCGTGQCASGTCIDLWVQRPSPDGPEDPQTGGSLANTIETQLPFNTDDVYVEVLHNVANLLGRAGASNGGTDTYTVDFEHRVEPDSGDLASPDSVFVPRPLQPGIQVSDFRAAWRDVNPGDVSFTARSGGTSFAQFADDAQAVQGTCVDLDVFSFDAFGEPTTGSVTVDVGMGTFVDDCTSLNPVTSVATMDGSGMVGLQAPMMSGDLALTLSIAGGNVVTQSLSITDMSAAPPISFSGLNGGAVDRTAPLDTPSVPFRLNLSNSSTNRVITVSVAGGSSTIACAINGTPGDACPGLNPVPNGVTNPCGSETTGGGAQSSCQIYIPAGSDRYDLRVRSTSSDAVVVTATDDNDSLANGTLALGAYQPESLTLSAPIRGYISYDGDYDFFRIALPAGLGRAGFTLNVDFEASRVDIRAQGTRAGNGGGIAVEGPGGTTDQCINGNCPGASTCDTRNTCENGVFNGVVGVNNDQCVYLSELDGELEIVVSDVNANDWDTTNDYEIQVDIQGGCPEQCSSSVCAQQ